ATYRTRTTNNDNLFSFKTLDSPSMQTWSTFQLQKGIQSHNILKIYRLSNFCNLQLTPVDWAPYERDSYLW
ncbi:hypothetical protein K1T71_013536, partial [Dendrolimus kikuchii]